MPYYVMKEGSQGQGIRLSDVEVILNKRIEVDLKKRNKLKCSVRNCPQSKGRALIMGHAVSMYGPA